MASSGVPSIQSHHNLVQGNYLGTDLSGTAALGNTCGVSIGNAIDNTIGGTSPGECNLISGNLGVGVSISGSTVAPHVERIADADPPDVHDAGE